MAGSVVPHLFFPGGETLFSMFSLMAGSFQQLTNWGEDETHDTEDEAKEESDVDSESGLSDDDDGGGSSLSGDGDEKFDDDTPGDGDSPTEGAGDGPLMEQLARILGAGDDSGDPVDFGRIQYYIDATTRWEAQIPAHYARRATGSLCHNPFLAAALTRCLTRVIAAVPACPKESQIKNRIQLAKELKSATWSNEAGVAPRGVLIRLTEQLFDALSTHKSRKPTAEEPPCGQATGPTGPAADVSFGGFSHGGEGDHCLWEEGEDRDDRLQVSVPL